MVRLTYVLALDSFYTPWKHKETSVFPCFQGIQKVTKNMRVNDQNNLQSFPIFGCLNSFTTKILIIETNPLICTVNQWTAFYMIGNSVMKEVKVSVSLRGVLRPLTDISDGAFRENSLWLKAVYYFFKRVSSSMFERVLITPFAFYLQLKPIIKHRTKIEWCL